MPWDYKLIMELKVTKLRSSKVLSEKVSKGTSNILSESDKIPRSRIKQVLNKFNKLVGYSSVHNKNYHFHEKTYESCFLPKVFYKSTGRLNRSIKDGNSNSPYRTPLSQMERASTRKVFKNYLLPAYFPTFK